MNCATCGRKIKSDNRISAIQRDFCSDVCHLRFWKEELPNMGGQTITDQDIKKIEQLKGDERKDFYNEIVNFIMDNFDATYFNLLLTNPELAQLLKEENRKSKI